MQRLSALVLWTLFCLLVVGCASKSLPSDTRLVLRQGDVARINRGLAQGRFVFTVPTRLPAPPSTCPQPTQPSCIWICTGTDPLDGIDDNTCSTNTYCCYGCGTGGADVCQKGS
jgi:hypothetical protein